MQAKKGVPRNSGDVASYFIPAGLCEISQRAKARHHDLVALGSFDSRDEEKIIVDCNLFTAGWTSLRPTGRIAFISPRERTNIEAALFYERYHLLANGEVVLEMVGC